MTFPGGKNRVYHRIINLMPPHQTYIEPFLGSGAVMRMKRPARLTLGADLDPKAVRLVASTIPVRSAETAARALEDAFRADLDAGRRPLINIAKKAQRRRGEVDSVDIELLYPGQSLWPAVPVDGRSRIWLYDGDAFELLERYPYVGHGREVVYCDPPYMMLSERSGRANYDHEMAEDQHFRLLRLLRGLPARILISGYWSALYADELREWSRIDFPGYTRKGTKTEYLWYNFEDPVQLHDYRYLGRDFRERERIQKKCRRWRDRFKGMPILERQALLSAISSITENGDGGLV